VNEINASLPTPESLDRAILALSDGLTGGLHVAQTAPRDEVHARVGEAVAAAVADSVSHINPPPGAIVLETPIRRGDQVISSLTLRKPDAGTLRGIKLADLLQMDVGALTLLLPRISTPTLTTADAAKLDPVDLVSIATEVGNFFLPKAQRESLSA